ncbi:MAG: hypothetical protein JNL67_22510 [Planctomycetaceae bacterium]|nr:hypothetical protein [Planctomycetaceae bacterium]
MERRALWSGGLKWLRNGTLGCGLAVGLLTGGAAATYGQSAEQVFGTNIHRLYDGQFDQLIAEVSAVVNEDLQDPRIFYLRGLALLRTGQDQAAADDLRKGAELEALQYGRRNYNIPRALQRIQGNDRALLEAARSDAMKRRSELRAAKAGIPRSQILAEMGRSILDPPQASTARPNLPDPSTLSDATAPFGEGWDNAPRPRPVQNATPSGGDTPANAPAKTETETNDPFGGGANSKPTEAADPFANPPKANDPFADPPKTDDPFADPPKSDDPFGGSR